jgi:hypothetical protein
VLRWQQRVLEVPVILVGPMLGWMYDWAFVDGRGSRLAAGRTLRAEAGVMLQIVMPSTLRWSSTLAAT